MKAKTKVERLLSIVDKGSIALSTAENEGTTFSDFGKFAITNNKIGAKTVTGSASSYCLYDIMAGEEILSDGCCCLSMPKLRNMLSLLPKEDYVELEFQEQKTDNSIGNMVFVCGKTSWRMPCAYPNTVADVNIDDGDFCLSIETEVFLDAVSSVSFAGNLNDANFVMSNVCISFVDKHVLFGATDDIRCAAFKTTSPNAVSSQKFLVPIKYLSKTLKVFDKGEVKMFSGNGFVRFSQEGHSVKLSLQDGANANSFPGFEIIVQKDSPFKLRAMTSRLKSMLIACNEMNKEECLMKIDDSAIHLYAYNSSDGMSYHSSLPYTGDKVNISMGVCCMFFLEYLKKVKEEVVQLEFFDKEGKQKRIIIQDNAGSFYLMKSLIDLVHMPPESI